MAPLRRRSAACSTRSLQARLGRDSIMPLGRFLRYLAPNLVTSLGMLFGLLSMVASYENRFVDAAWLIIWAVFLDKVDGLVARTLKATSPFGVQMDSFADAINFGIAPAFLVFVSVGSAASLGFDHGPGRGLLMIACALWVLGNVFRLAKFNVITDEAPGGGKFFFGVPTTLAAGTLVIWYIALHKYSAAGSMVGMPEMFRDPRIYGDWTIPETAWAYLPAAMIVGAFLMASNLPTPKLGPLGNRAVDGVLLLLVLTGYVCGFMRVLPEFMALMPTSWLLISLVWGQISPQARRLRAPPFIPSPPLEGEDADAEEEPSVSGVAGR